MRTEKKIRKLLIAIATTLALFLVVFLSSGDWLAEQLESSLKLNLFKITSYWIILLISTSFYLLQKVDAMGSFEENIDIIDFFSGLIYLCFFAFGIGLIFNFSFEYTQSKALANYEGSSVVSIDNKGGYLNGTIGTSTFASLVSVYDNYGLEVLELDSQGGLIKHAIEMAEFVEDNRIFTAVSGECASACVLVAISGQKLFVGPSAKFGFHNAASISQNQSERGKLTSQVGSETMFDFLKNNGIPDTILKRAKETPASSMFYVSGADLIRYGLAELIE